MPASGLLISLRDRGSQAPERRELLRLDELILGSRERERAFLNLLLERAQQLEAVRPCFAEDTHHVVERGLEGAQFVGPGHPDFLCEVADDSFWVANTRSRTGLTTVRCVKKATNTAMTTMAITAVQPLRRPPVRVGIDLFQRNPHIDHAEYPFRCRVCVTLGIRAGGFVVDRRHHGQHAMVSHRNNPVAFLPAQALEGRPASWQA